MIKGAVCKSVRCHLFFMQRRKGTAAGNQELQNDQQGVHAIDFQRLLSFVVCCFGRCQPVAVLQARNQRQALAHRIGRYAVAVGPDVDDSGGQDSAAIFQPEAHGEDVDESQMYAVSAVTTVAPDGQQLKHVSCSSIGTSCVGSSAGLDYFGSGSPAYVR